MDFWTGLAIGAGLIVIVAALAWCTRKPNTKIVFLEQPRDAKGRFIKVA